MDNEMKRYTFLHFSDIHFNKQSDSIFSPDRDLRKEMLNDIEQVILKKELSPYGIIICGDIAFSGQENEYKIADEFLETLTGKLKIDYRHVFCVPGNHDVDQSVAKKFVSVYAVQKLLEEADENEFQSYLVKLKEETEQQKVDLLYRALKGYNDFTGRYMGNVSSIEGPWTYPLELEDGYSLCLYGINSTIISNADDHRKDDSGKEVLRKMRLGNHQIPSRENKVIYMTICHHPIQDWKEDLGQVLDDRAMIQLFGHRHVQTLEQNEKRVRIGTGALQPDRREEGWQPRYNFLEVCIEHSKLRVVLYPRIWNKDLHKFICEESFCDSGKERKEIVLSLEHVENFVPEGMADINTSNIRETDDSKRELVYKLWSLQTHERESVLRKYHEFDGICLDDLNQNIVKILNTAEESKLLQRILKDIEQSQANIKK